MGALSELLPELDENHQPDILVGTSAGALNTAWLAANAHRPPRDVLTEGERIWQDMEWGTALESFPLSSAEFGLLLDGLRPRGARSVLVPSPLRRTLKNGPLSSETKRGIQFAQINKNVGPRLSTAAVVATRAASSLSVVFHDSVDASPSDDRLRGIAYASTKLGVDHVMASAAIPVAFPAVRVHDKRRFFDDWYYDGGTRLNTPIKPAIDLGADRLIIIALNSPWLGDDNKSKRRGPLAIDGAATVVQSVLIDPLVNDLHTLAKINEDVLEAEKVRKKLPPRTRTNKLKRRKIPYIVIAPPEPDTIGQIAASVFKRRYPGVSLTWKGLQEIWRSVNDVGFIGGRLDAGSDPGRGELLSYLFFDADFAECLIERGRKDARAWLDASHDEGAWQVKRLPHPVQRKTTAAAGRAGRAARGTGRRSPQPRTRAASGPR
jgi:NTE family protein